MRPKVQNLLCAAILFFIFGQSLLFSAEESTNPLAQVDIRIVEPKSDSVFANLPYIVETEHLVLAPMKGREMQKMGPTLILADDLEAFAGLFTISPDFEEGSISLAQYLGWFESSYLADKGDDEPRLLVYRPQNDGTYLCVGLVAVDKLEDDPAGASISLYISSKQARQGLGTELSTAGLAWISRVNTKFSYIRTTVRADNSASLALSRRMGLKVVSAFDAFYLDPGKAPRETSERKMWLSSPLRLILQPTYHLFLDLNLMRGQSEGNAKL